VTDARLPEDLLPENLWRRLAAAPRRCLVLDYDGTLAPFRVARDEAVPIEGVARSLSSIAELPDTSVWIVSGRPVREVERLLFPGGAPESVELVGEHGWERLTKSGRRIEPLPGDAEMALAACSTAAARRGWKDHIERKRTSIVLHTRGLPRELAEPLERDCERLWTMIGAATSLRVERIDGGVEARCATRDKGDVVREIIERCGEGALIVYVGDDATDEDAFRAVSPSGVALGVGREKPGSAAIGRFGSCEDVAGWLARWPEVLSRPLLQRLRSR
jgi:trehalose 6-phosphate phosphatase